MRRIIFILTVTICSTINIFAQDSGTKEEVDIDALRKEMQDKIDAMKAEMETAMQDMQSMMQDLQMNSAEGKNEIIINGDTIIVAPGDAFPEGFENLGGMFEKMPEDMDGMDFYFGGSEFDDLFGMMEQFKVDGMFNMNDFFQLTPPETKETPLTPEDEFIEEKETPKNNKKKKTYSL
jgi:hypothetical protein